jgi:hypothetical protein
VYLLFDILLVLLGASMLWYRERLARYMARVQQSQSRAWPWAYPGIIGRVYTSEKAWRNVFIPILAVASLFAGVLRACTSSSQNSSLPRVMNITQENHRLKLNRFFVVTRPAEDVA